ncbi:probable aspartyl protease At4g16563 [Dioscorea cayenensis subsp. rotundata]|uniref:Probable aspartyl protease At4g16563 n=1 Tax=Dioscorea cayennensis subsp. rotundata TaxID=55577 RepID=A0AB40CG93_DIOCR|nr:probable aspartyl protease At4g16563 [Dioscorea cayenensis subsp. rotundata]
MAPLLLFSLLILFPFCSSSDETPKITLQLNHVKLTSHRDPFHYLATLVNASLLRARHIRNHQTTPKLSEAPLYPHAYGGYSFSLGFGTPPQPIPVLLDTGSDVTWIPCTSSYSCRKCSSPSNPIPKIPTFFPKRSSSVRLLGCKNPKCSWFHSQDTLDSCRDCPSNSSTQCPKLCPPYIIIYGSGSTAGILLSETLDLGDRTVENFTVGCSVYSIAQPAGGIAGFGRGVVSLPAQVGAKRFSYCLVSRRFDDVDGKAGSVVIGGEQEDSAAGLSFTPMRKNPNIKPGSAASVYYYVDLKKITVGGKKVKIKKKTLVPKEDGSGGTIVDSGTTFTYLDAALMEAVAAAFEKAVAGRYNRSEIVETATGLRPCFEISSSPGTVLELPELGFDFKGGAELRLPVENCFVIANDPAVGSAACLAVIGGEKDGESAVEPAVILGSFQQQNYEVVYDLERERIGFQRKPCLNS